MMLVHRAYALDAIEQIYVLQYYMIASIVLLYYDHLLTFQLEVKRVWSRKPTLSSILFLLNRYIAFFGYIFILYLIFFPPSNNQVCKDYSRFYGLLSLVSQVIISILLTLRTYALYARSVPVLCFLALLALATIVTSAWTLSEASGILMKFEFTKLFGGAVFRTCFPGLIDTILFKVTFLLSTVFDTVISIMTVARTIRIVRQNKKFGARAALPHLLMRDGSVYFAVMVVANFINIFFFADKYIHSTLFAQSMGNNSVLSHVISVTMTSRLVLNLHGFADGRPRSPLRPCRAPRRIAPSPNGLHDDITYGASGTEADEAQLTTRISTLSTWIARAVDDFGTEGTQSSEDTSTSSASSSHLSSSAMIYGTGSHTVYSADSVEEGSQWFGDDFEEGEENETIEFSGAAGDNRDQTGK